MCLCLSKLEQIYRVRQGNVAVFVAHVALGFTDLDKSTGAVNILDFQVGAFGQAQAAGIDRG